MKRILFVAAFTI
jgi:hypothetical protein